MGVQPLRVIQGMEVRESLANKLKSARKFVGMSTRAVASKLGKRFPVSHATIANYENGKWVRLVDFIAAIAEIYERPINWFLERGRGLVGVRYRNLKSRVNASELHRFEADVQRWTDAYVTLESRLKRPLKSSVRTKGLSSLADPEDLSRDVRRRLGVSEEEPIPSVVEVLEKFGVRVLEQPTELRIDGLAAQYGDEYLVVLNPEVSNDRVRLNAAHELAHVLFGDIDQSQPESPQSEQRAFEFASHFLLPNNQLKKAFVGKSMVRMVHFKERFGISLAAMIYRADRLGFIKKAETNHLWSEFAARGWKSNEPGSVRPDRATRFEQLIDEARVSGQMSVKEIADLAGVRPEAIRSRLNYAMGITENDGPEENGPDTIEFPQ